MGWGLTVAVTAHRGGVVAPLHAGKVRVGGSLQVEEGAQELDPLRAVQCACEYDRDLSRADRHPPLMLLSTSQSGNQPSTLCVSRLYVGTSPRALTVRHIKGLRARHKHDCTYVQTTTHAAQATPRVSATPPTYTERLATTGGLHKTQPLSG